MRILFLLILMISAGNVFSQAQPKAKTTQQTKTAVNTTPQTKNTVNTSQQKAEPFDTIVRFGNRKIAATRLNLGALDISYALPSKPDSLIRLSKKEVEKIIYKNGAILQLNKSLVEEVKADQWQAVLVTKNSGDVQGLYKRGEYTVRSSPKAKDKKKALEGAYARLQKYAAGKKSTYVLITNTRADGGYGDLPVYIIDAEVYGPEPPETGTDVTDSTKNKK